MIDGVYFIISGEFEVTQALKIKNELSENRDSFKTKHILRAESEPIINLFESIRQKNLKGKLNNRKYRIALLGEMQMIGSEEIIKNIDYRKTTVTCYSSHASCYFMPTKTFMQYIELFGLQEKIEEELDNNMDKKTKGIQQLEDYY